MWTKKDDRESLLPELRRENGGGNMKTRQEENIEMISKIVEYTGIRSESITNIVLIDISKSLAVIADAADSIKTKINNRF